MLFHMLVSMAKMPNKNVEFIGLTFFGPAQEPSTFKKFQKYFLKIFDLENFSYLRGHEKFFD